MTTSASAPFDLPTKMKLIPSLFLLLQLLAPLAFAAAPDAEAPAPRFVINTVGDVSADDQAKVLAALEASYGRISVELKTMPEQPFSVYLYSSRLGYAWATGNWGASGSAPVWARTPSTPAVGGVLPRGAATHAFRPGGGARGSHAG